MKRLSVWLSEETEAAIIELSGGVGEKRSAWVRAAIDAAIDTARHPDRITIVPADDSTGSPVASPCAVDVAGLQAEMARLMDECSTLEVERRGALQRASDADKEIANLGRLLDERRDEVGWLRGQVALLNERTLIPEKAGRRWWRFW